MTLGKRKLQLPGQKKPEHRGLTSEGVKERIEKLLKSLGHLTDNKEYLEAYKECLILIEFLDFEERLLNTLYRESMHYSKKSTLVPKGRTRSF